MESDGLEKRGYWLIAKWGGMFLRGEIDMPVSVETRDNHRIGKLEELACTPISHHS